MNKIKKQNIAYRQPYICKKKLIKRELLWFKNHRPVLKQF